MGLAAVESESLSFEKLCLEICLAILQVLKPDTQYKPESYCAESWLEVQVKNYIVGISKMNFLAKLWGETPGFWVWLRKH